MNQALCQLLGEIEVYLNESGDVAEAPATSRQLQSLQETCAQQLSYELPDALFQLLALHDGVSCNGIQLYASEARTQADSAGKTRYLKRGLVEANLIWREFEPNKGYVFFAESGSDLYQHNLKINRFEVADRVGRTVFEQFATVEELFETLFNHMLDRYGIVEEEA